MSNQGRDKLLEEMGELSQVLAKLNAFPACVSPEVLHPDGTDLGQRLVEEIADVTAAIELVMMTHSVDQLSVKIRAVEKFQMYLKWHQADS